MSSPVRCLLDKAAARRILEGLLRLTEGHELTEEQLLAVDLLQRAERQGIQLFVTAGTVNILGQLADVHSAVIAVFLDRYVSLTHVPVFERVFNTFLVSACNSFAGGAG